MQLRGNRFVSFISSFISFISLLAFPAQAAWQEPVWSAPTCAGNQTTPRPPGCWLPLNVSDSPQIKTGSLTVGDSVLAGKYIMAFNQLGVGFGNSLDITQLDPAAALDVAGAMRIRKGCLPSGVDCTNKVLTADANGTAGWADLPPPLSGLSPGFAVIINQSGSISQIAFQGVQARITGTCTGNNYSAITAISGTTGTTSCLALVSSITASAAGGLTGGGQGAVSLGVNAGSGLTINGNKLVINPPAADFGLTVSGNFLKFSSAGCTGNNVYWKYDTTTGWSCGGPVLVNRPPGESVMYLKARSPGDPPACPDTVFDTGLWTDLGVTAEFVSATVSVKHNVRTCVKSAPAIKPICQTMYLKSASPTSPPSCPSGWLTTGTQTTEYASGDSNYLNNVRTCFKCN